MNIPILAAEAADQTVLLELLGSWWPLVAAVLIPTLTSFTTKAQAEKIVKQGVAIVFTAALVVAQFANDSFDDLNPATILTRIVIYSGSAEAFYRAASMITNAQNVGATINDLSIFRPNSGIGTPTHTPTR